MLKGTCNLVRTTGKTKLPSEEIDKDHKGLRGVLYSKWASRFTWTAILQGAIVALLTAMLAAITATTAFPQKLVQMMLLNPEIGFSEVSALAGLGLYLVVGVVGTGLTAQFYHHFEIRMRRPYQGRVVNVLAWAHLILINVGIAAASIMMIYAGYIGDIAASPKNMGGFGMTTEQVANQILNPFIMPVAAMMLVTVFGALAGGAGFLVNHFRR